MVMTIINIQKYQYISSVYLISYIQHSCGADTAFYGTYSYLVHCVSYCLSVIARYWQIMIEHHDFSLLTVFVYCFPMNNVVCVLDTLVKGDPIEFSHIV